MWNIFPDEVIGPVLKKWQEEGLWLSFPLLTTSRKVAAVRRVGSPILPLLAT